MEMETNLLSTAEIFARLSELKQESMATIASELSETVLTKKSYQLYDLKTEQLSEAVFETYETALAECNENEVVF